MGHRGLPRLRGDATIAERRDLIRSGASLALLLAGLGLASAGLAEEAAFAFAGLHRQDEIAEIQARYPASRRVGDYLYVAPRDSHDHIYGIELSGQGDKRRLRASFERPPDAPIPDGSGRYPRCEDVERTLAKSYGPPAAVDRFAEEASRRADRLWRRDTEELRLICFAEPGRPGPFFAEAVLITARRPARGTSP